MKKLIAKLLNIHFAGTRVTPSDTIKMTHLTVELPAFELVVKYELKNRGLVSKRYFDMNCKICELGPRT